MNATVEHVTQDIIARSASTRADYLARMKRAEDRGPRRHHLACSNLAHGVAACGSLDKQRLMGAKVPNIAIVSAYNDMLSAHQPFQTFPARIKKAASKAGAVAQFAGGVPAMCDGVTQGEAGMELSLLSRDIIAMSTAVALSHDMFDGVLCLGVCDKIVPGLLIGALSFGQLPVVFVPAGPMPTGISNEQKRNVRMLYAEKKVGRAELLTSETEAYHSAGTCTFYGTANSNQMLMEVMGLHLPGASFVNPNTRLRDALTDAAAARIVNLTKLVGDEPTPLYQVIDERAIVNGIIGLHATGGSTNHTIHIVAIARAAGIQINWDDFSRLSAVVPSLTRVYPNGSADVNAFHNAGGMGRLIGELLDAGLLHDDVTTVAGPGLSRYREVPELVEDALVWNKSAEVSRDDSIISTVATPFAATGGLRLIAGNLGRAVIKVSAVAEAHRIVEAPAIVFNDQNELLAAFERGELERDFVAVVRFQGPRANGMPELHKLTPTLSVLQGRGFHVALVTDGRMSGASGKVPAAIHIVPEAAAGGPLSRVVDGDVIRLDATAGTLTLKLSDEDLADRPVVAYTADSYGMGRELFASLRGASTSAEEGAMTFGG